MVAAITSPPLPYKRAYRTWFKYHADRIVDELREHVCDSVYYFAMNGSDSNDGLSPLTPKQSISAAATIIGNAAAGTSTEIRLKCGDTWTGEFAISGPNAAIFKITSYGVGPKPKLCSFVRAGYEPNLSRWTQVSGNQWKLTTKPTTWLGWIREALDPYNPYMYVATVARTLEVPYSWTHEGASASFTADASTDVITSNSHGFADNDTLYVTSATTLPGGLTAGTVYYVINSTANTFKVSTSQGGSAVNITSTGSGIHAWHALTKATMGDFYINSGGVDPNTKQWECVPNKWDADSAIWFAAADGDGGCKVYIEGILTEGHGVSAQHHTHINSVHGIKIDLDGSDYAAVVDCEAYYHGSHCMAHAGTGAGGTVVWRRCKVGYVSIDGTSHNTYSSGGGAINLFDNPIWQFGKCPSEAYTDTYGSVILGGPSRSAYVGHCGASNKLGFVGIYNGEMIDPRRDCKRATYEIGSLSATAANIEGTAGDHSTYRTYFHLKPINRLAHRQSVTVTADSSADTIIATGHGFENGDQFQLTSTGGVPSGLTSRQWYSVTNKTATSFQVGQRRGIISSVDTSANTFTTSYSAGFATNDRVMFKAMNGALPGGLSEAVLYHVVGASGATFGVSLTQGGANVDITDAGHGDFFAFGQLINFTTNGTGTITAHGIAIGESAFIEPPNGSFIANQNLAIQGLVRATASGSAVTGAYYNPIIVMMDWAFSTVNLLSPGHEIYNGYIWYGGRPTLNSLFSGSSGSSKMFNSIVAINKQTGSTYTSNLTNDTAHQRANAYYDPGGAATSGSSGDDMKVALSTDPGPGSPPPTSLDTEGLANANSIALDYDILWNERAAGSIGPGSSIVYAPSECECTATGSSRFSNRSRGRV